MGAQTFINIYIYAIFNIQGKKEKTRKYTYDFLGKMALKFHIKLKIRLFFKKAFIILIY